MEKLLCGNCENYLELLRCKAFPDRNIPDEILLGDDNHDKIHPEQTGDFVFEPKEK